MFRDYGKESQNRALVVDSRLATTLPTILDEFNANLLEAKSDEKKPVRVSRKSATERKSVRKEKTKDLQSKSESISSDGEQEDIIRLLAQAFYIYLKRFL